MASVHISSRKVDAGNGRSRHDFSGNLHSEEFGIVFSCDALILNLTDGNRRWSVVFSEDATRKLAGRFTMRFVGRQIIELRDALRAQVDASRILMDRIGFDEETKADCTAQAHRVLSRFEREYEPDMNPIDDAEFGTQP